MEQEAWNKDWILPESTIDYIEIVEEPFNCRISNFFSMDFQKIKIVYKNNTYKEKLIYVYPLYPLYSLVHRIWREIKTKVPIHYNGIVITKKKE